MSLLRVAVTVAGSALLLVACDDSTSPSNQAVTVRFAAASAGTGGASANVAAAGGAQSALTVSGSNGTLQIDRIAFIVSRVEFERSDDACEGERHGDDDNAQRSGDDNGQEDECDEFRFAPKFVHLELPDGVVNVGTDELPEGSWNRLKFRVKNIDFDDDDNDHDDSNDQVLEDNGLTALLATARASFTNWPQKASLAVVGTFLPTGSTNPPIPFTAFFNGEIKVVMPLQPPLEVSAAGASRAVTVELDPAKWFQNGDGTVVNLSAFDFATTQRVVELRVKMREGFLRVRFDN